jgi:hypothetical protein
MDQATYRIIRTRTVSRGMYNVMTVAWDIPGLPAAESMKAELKANAPIKTDYSISVQVTGWRRPADRDNLYKG